MKLKKSLVKCRTWILFLLLNISLLFTLNNGLLSDAITCISIIFAFSQSFLLAAYANQEINLYMKKHNMFEKFIYDNKKFLKTSLFSLLFLFFLNAFSFSYNYKDTLYLSSAHIALLIIVFQLDYTFDFADKYMNLYKNSYSDKVLNKNDVIVEAQSKNT